MTTPYQQDEDLDFIVLGITPSPGLVTLSGHDRVKNWDVQKAKGTTGATSQLNGDPIGQFTATFYLASFGPNGAPTNDFENWEDFQRLLEGLVNGAKPIAVPIYHPDLARNKFTEVSVARIGGMAHDGNGGATVEVEFIEYKPPKPRPAAGAKAKPGVGGKLGSAGKDPKIDPNWRAKAELAELTALANDPWANRRS